MSPSSENSPEPMLVKWLEGLGLGQYAALFIREKLTLELMPDVADLDLQGLGLPLGHRITILRAARLLVAEGSAIAAPSTELQEPESAPQRTAYRPLTVMFCDLTGSVSLSRFYGPEEFRNLLSEYRLICATAARRYDGFTARYVGDGILMYFGYPTAHEDDAERALRAALEIRAGISELDKRTRGEANPRIAVHLGVATGDVVVGDIVTGDTVEMAAATGDAPNLAARLQAAAAPGMILIDQATRDRAGELFEYGEVDMQQLKGFDDPVRILQLNGERASTRFEARSGSRVRLLGRDEQLAALNRQWKEAKSGKFQVALIAGPAGIGKSRLIDAVRAAAVEEARSTGSAEPIILQFQCSQFFVNTPLSPITRAIERLAKFERGDAADERMAKLRGLLEGLRLDAIGDNLSKLADLMDLPRLPDFPTVAMEARERRYRQLSYLQGWLSSLARVQPVLLAVEDVQWIDPTTQQLLRHLYEAADPRSMLLVLTLRTDDESEEALRSAAARAHVDWFAQASAEVYRVNRLEERHIHALIGAVAEDPLPPEKVINAIAVRSQGNPLFVEELTRGWLEATRGRPRPHIDPNSRDLGLVGVPDSLSSALMARVDQLGPAKELALKAAVLGAEFTASLLSRLRDTLSRSFWTDLATLSAEGVVISIPNAMEPTYRFNHALVQEAAYGSLLRSERAAIHYRAAVALEEERASRTEISPDLIAQHYAKGNAPEKAVKHWQEAAAQAFAKSAHVEAERLLNLALALVPTLPPTPERQVVELELTAACATAARSVRGYASPVVEARYLRARNLCGRTATPQTHFNIDWGLFQCFLVKGQLQKAEEFAENLVILSTDMSEIARADAYLAKGMTRIGLGAFEPAREFLEKAIILTSPMNDAPSLHTHGQNPGLFARSNLAHVLAFLGHVERARSLARENLDIARGRHHEPDHKYSYISTLTFSARVFLLFREADEVRRLSEELLGLARSSQYSYYEAIARTQLAWALADDKPSLSSIDTMRQGIAALEATGTKLAARGFVLLLVDLLLRAGDVASATELLRSGATIGQAGTAAWDSEVKRLHGLAITLDPGKSHALAESHFRAGLEIARAQRTRTLELRVALSYARLLCATQRHAEALDLIKLCLSNFPNDVMLRDLTEARLLTNEIGGIHGSLRDRSLH